MRPQVPAEQRTQRLWCRECFLLEYVDIEDVPEDSGWREGRCPDCAETEKPLPPSSGAAQHQS